MGFLILSGIFAISFAWMWSRNEKARKRLKRLKPTHEDKAIFNDWKDQTLRRMSRADLAAGLLTMMPSTLLFGSFGIILGNLCAWPALGLAFGSSGAGRRADALAKKLGFKRGVDWLTSKDKPGLPDPPKAENADFFISQSTIQPEPEPNMKSTEFEVVIPEGKDLNDGYVGMPHGTRYSLLLRNHRGIDCDAEVAIDGIQVGIWRINRNSEIRIERPVHDTGHFTFFEVGSSEAHSAGISPNPDNGLISVTFKPERNHMILKSSPTQTGDMGAGATGLTGESSQRFESAPNISHDMANAFTIHIRLVSKRQDIRPLAPRSTPVPPPVG
jgi:hypothetical protein